MADSQHVKGQLKKCFGHTDIYAILEVERDAHPSAIKKAYMKLALRHHPDKGGEAETFQAISVAHAILSDPEKRKVYDKSGLVDDLDEDMDQNFAFWYQHFRNLTPTVTVQAIDKLEEAYVGSDEEKNDIVTAFMDFKGDVSKVMDSVMFAEAGSEARICRVIDQAIEEGLIKKTKVYTQSKAKALERMAKAKKNPKKRAAPAAEQDDLALMIRERQQGRAAALGNIFSKYGEGLEEDAEEMDDAEFEEARAKVSKKAKAASKAAGKAGKN